MSRDIPDSELNAEIWRLCRFLMPLKPKDEEDDFDDEYDEDYVDEESIRGRSC